MTSTATDVVVPLPDKKYNIIYADPPWSFSSKEIQRYGGGGGVRFGSPRKGYPVQHSNWIRQLPVSSIAARDCALFLWSTDAHIKEAIEVMEAWGFKYKTVAFVWEKKTARGLIATNLGAWTLKSYELCLLGTRGRMLQHKKVNNICQRVEEKRTGHSRKPERVRRNIEKLFGELPRIELFARQETEGWDVWGDAVEVSR